MTQDYTRFITPPPEVIGEWWIAWDALDETDRPRLEDFIAVKAAQYGADQELEACCEWLGCGWKDIELVDKLRSARRPKPPSLKEQALLALSHLLDGAAHSMDTTEPADYIRRALEQLPAPLENKTSRPTGAPPM
jgi:hypothetical protein